MTTPMVSGAAESFVAAFDALTAESTAPERVQSLRRAGFERFAALGFPTTKNEDWHYTSVSPIAEREYTLVTSASGDVTEAQLATFEFGASDWHRIVLLNGRFSPELSSIGVLPTGVRVESLAEAARTAPELLDSLGSVATSELHAFTALNTAFIHDGVVIRVPRGIEVEKPIHVVYITDANAAKAMLSPRTSIVVERQARATVIESFVSTADAQYFTNAVTEIELGDGATLHHHKIQREAARAYHVGTIEARQARDSHFVSFSFAVGADLSRTNVYSSLDGEGCGVTLNGLYLLSGTQHCDHQTQVVHAQPNCYSRELYKGILDDQSHGVFNGKVYVHPIAQKTDGKQTNNTLLLSPTARIDTKPQLEIFADDVKCTHGATVGQIDRTALFYMKSRGLGAESARRLLTYAFAADVLETIECDPVKEALEGWTLARYTKTAGA